MAAVVVGLVALDEILHADRVAFAVPVARDRVGEKPLYWAKVKECIVFGSELKALMAHPANMV